MADREDIIKASPKTPLIARKATTATRATAVVSWVTETDLDLGKAAPPTELSEES